jgi:hypothetical protein
MLREAVGVNGHPVRGSIMEPLWADRWVWACRLGADADTFSRLLDGETVPVDELDPGWVETYRIRFPWRVTEAVE